MAVSLSCPVHVRQDTRMPIGILHPLLRGFNSTPGRADWVATALVIPCYRVRVGFAVQDRRTDDRELRGAFGAL